MAGGFLGDKAADVMKDVMEDYGMEPGELYESIQRTMEVIDELEPILKRMDQRSADLNEDVEELKGDVKGLEEEIGQFNENAGDLVEALEDNKDTMETVGQIFKDMQEGDLENSEDD